MRLLLLVLFSVMSFNAHALFGFGDKPEVEGVVEVYIKTPARFIAGPIIEPVWEEASSNEKLVKYTVKIVLTGVTDKYGNEKPIELGVIVFDKSLIAEIKKYKRSDPFFVSKNEIHQWVLSQFMALDN